MCFIVCKSTIINLIVKVKNKANEKFWPSFTFSCTDVNKVKRNKSLQCNLNPWAQQLPLLGNTFTEIKK